jgi:hypothetical protein
MLGTSRLDLFLRFEGTAVTSSFDTLQSLHHRLDQLERSNRRWRMSAPIMLTLLGIILLSGSQNAGKDGAPFTVYDKDGKQRAWLGLGADGPALRFFDDKGEIRAVIGLGAQAMTMRLLNARGRLQTGLSVEPLGVAIVS